MKRKVLVLLGSLFLLNGLILCVVANFNFGNLITIGVGLLCIGMGIFDEKIQTYSKNVLFRIFKNICGAGMNGVLFLSMFLAYFGWTDTCTYTEDAVIVLGTSVHGKEISATLKHRLDKAVEYHKKNPKALIVVTGGQGPQEDVTEAYAMEQYLIKNGVNPDVILKEEESTSTSENIKFSKKMLDKYFEKDYSVTVITNTFHIYRGAKFAQSRGFEEVTTMHAEMEWYSVLPCYLRECGAVLKMWILKF